MQIHTCYVVFLKTPASEHILLLNNLIKRNVHVPIKYLYPEMEEAG